MKAKLVSENLNFERGQEPYKAIGLGKHRMVKKDEPIEVNYQGREIMQCIALDDEEYDEKAERHFIDFMDKDGGICWAVRNYDTGEWEVPNMQNESLEFERTGEVQKTLRLGKFKKER